MSPACGKVHCIVASLDCKRIFCQSKQLIFHTRRRYAMTWSLKFAGILKRTKAEIEISASIEFELWIEF